MKKTTWQSSGNCELKFQVDTTVKGMAFKNSGKVTELRVAPGLPKDSKPNNKSLFETAKSETSRYNNNSVNTARVVTHPTPVSQVASQLQNTKVSLHQSNPSMNYPIQNPVKNSNTALNSSNQSLSNSQSSLAAQAAAKKKPPPPPAKKVPRCEALYVKIS